MSHPLSEGTLIADRYHLVHKVGRGGMGDVWLAGDVTLDVARAVKVLHPSEARSPSQRARFELEGKMAARLAGTHVVGAIDMGVWEEIPFLVMEYLVGETLSARLSRLGVLDARATASIVGQAARALTRAHAEGVIHRDIKPGNLFLVQEDEREIVKLLDFGIAKRIGAPVKGLPAGLTVMGSLIGTPAYMSPEQIQAKPWVDHRADLWALGVLAYRCLTGHLPFRGATVAELLVRIVGDPAPVPSEVAPVPVGFDAWWARAAARDPGRRFTSAEELAGALLRIAGAAVDGDSGDLGTFEAARPFPLVSRKSQAVPARSSPPPEVPASQVVTLPLL